MTYKIRQFKLGNALVLELARRSGKSLPVRRVYILLAAYENGEQDRTDLRDLSYQSGNGGAHTETLCHG